VSEANALPAWTIDRVIAELPRLGRFDQREPLEALSDQRDALREALRRALPTRDGFARLNAAVMLLKLQDVAGRDTLLATLRGDEMAAATAAMNFLIDVVPYDRPHDRHPTKTKVPVSAAEIFTAISPCLQDLHSEPGKTALFICLSNDIEASRTITRPLLQHASGATRLKVATWYLRHGRDDGALRALEALYEAAPSDAAKRDPRWYDLKSSWSAVHDCCRTAAEPLRTQAARMAMRIVRTTLDAPDSEQRTHVNDGFINIGSAARAIACVMPDGTEALLEQIITGKVDDFGRGGAIGALADGAGVRSHALVRAMLADEAVRQDAAVALGKISKGSNDADDIAALAAELATEDRAQAIGAVLHALAEIGPDGETHVAAALQRAPPWTRMELSWRLEGLSARQIADMLTAAGAMDAIDDAALAKATRNGVDLLGLLWEGGKRLAHIGIKADSSPPPHHALFQALLDIARPRLGVNDLTQTDDDNYRREPVAGAPNLTAVTDLGTICTVGFAHGETAHSFVARPIGRWLDVAAVLQGFNQFMAALGREDRCFQLATADSEYGFFLVAPESRFLAVAQRLHLALELDPDRGRRAGIAYVQQVVSGHEPHGRT
jgi:hypothetical protein